MSSKILVSLLKLNICLQRLSHDESTTASPHNLLTFKAIPYDGALAFERTFIIHAAHADSPKPQSPTRSTYTPSEHFPTPAPAPAPTPAPATAIASEPPPKRHLNSETTENEPVKRQKKLDMWFKPGTIDDVNAYHRRTDEEWYDKVDEVRRREERHRIDEENRKRGLAADRKRNQRARQVAEDIHTGRRDSMGKLIKKPKVRFLFFKGHTENSHNAMISAISTRF